MYFETAFGKVSVFTEAATYHVSTGKVSADDIHYQLDTCTTNDESERDAYFDSTLQPVFKSKWDTWVAGLSKDDKLEVTVQINGRNASRR